MSAFRTRFRYGSAVVSSATKPMVLWTFTVPAGSRAALTHISMMAGDITAYGSITWRVRRNSIPLAPLDNNKDMLGSSEQMIPVGDEIIANGGDVLDCEASSTSTISFKVGSMALIELT